MAHNGHDRCPRLHLFRFVFDVQLDFFDRRMRTRAALAFFQFKPEFILGANALRHVLANRLIDVGEFADLHQVGNDLEWLALQLLSQIANDDRRFERNDLIGRERNKFFRPFVRGWTGGRRSQWRPLGESLSALLRGTLSRPTTKIANVPATLTETWAALCRGRRAQDPRLGVRSG